MDTSILSEIKKIHFVGIGGSGMCPMAEILSQKGYTITGSDISESDTVERVRSHGIKVFIGHSSENIGDAEAIVYTAASKSDNPELVAAEEKGIPIFERAKVLGFINEMYETPIDVSGTHGKTSTTGMITQILIEDGKDPSAIIGGMLPIINGNSTVGKSDILVCEACEYVDTFLQIHPKIAVITNIEADHLDYFKTLDNIIKSFHQFEEQTSGTVIINGDDLNSVKSIEGIKNTEIITFGLSDKFDYYPTELNEKDTACESFTLMCRREKLGRVNLTVPGEHNMLNALAAAAAAHTVGATPETICSALGHFSGVHRRFEILGTFDGVTVADDFAHHPTELTAVLSSAMKMGYNEVWAIFQPHTYSRTHTFLDDFAKALAIPNHLIMTEILAVREVNKFNIHTSDLAEKIPGSCWFDSFDKIADYVMKNAKENDLILTLGGGDIYKCANLLVEKYKELQK